MSVSKHGLLWFHPKIELEKSKELKEIISNLNKDFAEIQCDEHSPLSIDLENEKKMESSWEEKITLIGKIIQEEDEKYNDINQSLEKIQAKLDKINEQTGSAQQIKEAAEKLEKEQKELVLKKKEFEKIKKEYEDIKLKEADILKIKEDAALLKKDLSEYDRLSKINDELIKNEKFFEENKMLLSEAEKKEASAEEKIKEVKKIIDELKGSGELFEKLKARKTSLNEQETKIESLSKDAASYKNLISLVEKLQTDAKKAFSEYEKAQNEYEMHYKNFMRAQAGILAEELKDNKPCPVCGSLNHPHKAEKEKNVLSEARINELKQAMEKCDENQNKITAEISLKTGEQRILMNTIEKNASEIFNSFDFNQLEKIIKDKKSEIENDLSECTKQLSVQENNKNQKEKNEKLIPELEEQLKIYSKEKAELKNSVSVYETQIKSLKKQIDEMTESLEYKSKEDAEKKIREFENNAFDLRNKIDNLKNKHDEFISEINGTEKSIQVNKDIISKAENSNLDKLKEEKEELTKKKNILSDERDLVFQKNNINKKSLEKIRSQSKNLMVKEKAYMMAASLSNTANGKVSGKEKIMLETFVQMYYFDRVIQYANRRLMVMTDSHYELKRSENENEKKSQTGLGLNVVDHYNGCERNVKSLSGGEAFQASLSLALGLSDEVSNEAGGIKIESMFVDEGFGSLDKDSLDNAMNALVTISERNCLVGIISHVDILKEKIDRQLIVKKSLEGTSFITMQI